MAGSFVPCAFRSYHSCYFIGIEPMNLICPTAYLCVLPRAVVNDWQTKCGSASDFRENDTKPKKNLTEPHIPCWPRGVRCEGPEVRLYHLTDFIISAPSFAVRELSNPSCSFYICNLLLHTEDIKKQRRMSENKQDPGQNPNPHTMLECAVDSPCKNINLLRFEDARFFFTGILRPDGVVQTGFSDKKLPHSERQ